MARLLLPLAAVAALAPVVSAGIKFTKPAAGATLDAGTAIEVAWQEGGTGPKLTELLTYELFLCIGGNDAADQVSNNRPGRNPEENGDQRCAKDD